MQINRLFEIVYILLDRKTVTAGALAARLGVSIRFCLTGNARGKDWHKAKGCNSLLLSIPILCHNTYIVAVLPKQYSLLWRA